MSKIQIPEHIIFIGASIYTDIVQRSYLERTYPYIRTATVIERFPTYTPQVKEYLLSLIDKIKNPVAIFVMDKFFDKVINDLKAKSLKASVKSDGNIYSIHDNLLLIKKVSLFEKLPTPITIKNKNIAAFKLFGEANNLNLLEDKLLDHAIITKVLPTWYNIQILDKEGEIILVKSSKELNIKVLPISSVRASLIEYLSKKGKTLTFAESCTGGLLAAKLTAISGASKVINGSVVAYSNEIKNRWLNVPNDVLEKYGAVSKECVSYMLDGIQNMAQADIAVAISGIAGPTGETETKKVGTVFIGIKDKDKKEIKEFLFKGDRNFIQEQSARKAIEMILYSQKDFFDFFEKSLKNS